jgi:energy-coupling factor transporter ATP-binding protein EcfA2
MRWEQNPVLVVEHLTMQFGGLIAVNDLSTAIGRGDITALIGPNGAGKSTVVNLLTGALRPTAGEAMLGAVRVTGRKPHQVTAAGQSWAGSALLGVLGLIAGILAQHHRRPIVAGERTVTSERQGGLSLYDAARIAVIAGSNPATSSPLFPSTAVNRPSTPSCQRAFAARTSGSA